jgi:DNA-directed RNA polymerase beta' subunit
MFDVIPIPPLQIRAPDPLTGKPGKLTVALKMILTAIQNPKNPATRMDEVINAYKIYVMQKEELKLSESNETLIGLHAILDGKEGHIRSVVNGKRTNYCARTVVSPDPNLKITEIGVPREIAQNITTQETIFSLNIDLYESILEGKHKMNDIGYIRELFTRYIDYKREIDRLEGLLTTNAVAKSDIEQQIAQYNRKLRYANTEKRDYIENELYRLNHQMISNSDSTRNITRQIRTIKRDNKSMVIQYQLFYQTRGDIKYITRNGRDLMVTQKLLDKGFKLRLGDVIHRTIIDGDPVTINRQPGLHKYSIIGGIVIVKPYRTIGVHPCFTAGLGMDFDGPENKMDFV